MKRLILTIATVMALTMAGALVAQSPQNTTAPGPTQQLEPGQTNNNLPNPGNPVQVGPQPQTPPVQEQGTVSGTATESITGNQGANTTGPVTGTTNLDQTDVDEQTTTGTYTDTADDTDTLPATAGELPTVALIGLLALAAAFLVRVKRHA
jgi:hypothetical protein